MKIWRERVTVIVRHQGAILAFRATDPTTQVDYVFLPGGEIEVGESREQAATRECLEETGYSVRLDLRSEFVRDYDFSWDGQVYLCRTWFYAAEVIQQTHRQVRDASYHRGMMWVPEAEAESVFSYHPEILNAVRHFLGDSAAPT
jgi:tRNA(adenine34) deaminase